MLLSLEEALVVVGGLCVRAMMSIHPHSGQGTPPMFGDFEAQRHWQEITVNLPLKDWYRNTPDNNLTYWGLDYPPLTAYHSYLLGRAARLLDQSPSVALKASHGHETPEHKMWMRASVLLADILVYVPAVLAFARAAAAALNNGSSKKSSGERGLLSVVLLMLYPGLILIDGGHFQYNNVSLGLFIGAVAAVFRGNKDCLASCLFVCALNYKQMELYHALPFFFYFLGKVWSIAATESMAKAAAKLAAIGTTVVATFALIWAPFLLDLSGGGGGLDLDCAKQVLGRVFPVQRGLFEDKVANFWCSLNVVVKVKQLYSLDQLVLASLAATLTTALPTNLLLLFKPTNQNLLFALLNTSLAFFLFSFHVHEKTILLVAAPLLMLLTHSPFSLRRSSLVACWFAVITVFSMWPLLQRDLLALPAFCLIACFLLLCHHANLLRPDHRQMASVSSNSSVSPKTKSPKPLTEAELQGVRGFTCADWMVWTLFNLSLMGCLFLGYASVRVPPPPRYPDLWPLLISVYSAGHFALFFVYFHNFQLRYHLSLSCNRNSAAVNVADQKKKRN